MIREQVIFNFCTDYYYKKPINTIDDFSFTNSDYENFKKYVATSDFKYQTNTEKVLNSLEKQAVKDDMILEAEISQLKNTITAEKTKALTTNQEELTRFITDKLVTRYFYKEGLYEYQLTHHEDIKKGIEILNSGKYKTILK